MEITIKWNVDSKSDEEAKKKVMALLKNTQGALLSPLPDWDPEALRTEIQDLKLETDRLKQREEIMLHFINSCACRYSCAECDIKNKAGLCHYRKCSNNISTGTRMTNTAEDILSKLEAL